MSRSVRKRKRHQIDDGDDDQWLEQLFTRPIRVSTCSHTTEQTRHTDFEREECMTSRSVEDDEPQIRQQPGDLISCSPEKTSTIAIPGSNRTGKGFVASMKLLCISALNPARWQRCTGTGAWSVEEEEKVNVEFYSRNSELFTCIWSSFSDRFFIHDVENDTFGCSTSIASRLQENLCLLDLLNVLQWRQMWHLSKRKTPIQSSSFHYVGYRRSNCAATVPEWLRQIVA